MRIGCVSFVAMYAAANVPTLPAALDGRQPNRMAKPESAEHGEEDHEVHDDGDGAVLGQQVLNGLFHSASGTVRSQNSV